MTAQAMVEDVEDDRHGQALRERQHLAQRLSFVVFQNDARTCSLAQPVEAGLEAIHRSQAAISSRRRSGVALPRRTVRPALGSPVLTQA
jgi:hypothetical protein